MMKPQLELILPVYNERLAIEAVLREWHETLSPKIAYRFIICEDGSTDGTRELLVKLQRKYPIVLNDKKVRRGYSRAVVDGILSASAPYVLCIDSDGQCDPGDFFRFWQKRNQADVLTGWRTTRADTWQRKLFSGAFKRFFFTLFPTTIHDPSAPYVLFKPERILPYISKLTLMKEGFWWGFIGVCVNNHLSVSEIPIHHRPRIDGQTNVYQLQKIPGIAILNGIGLLRVRFGQ